MAKKSLKSRLGDYLVLLSRSSALSAIRAAVLTLLLYCLFAAVFFTNVEGWTTMEAIYFAMVTMSTVGFGDLSPKIWYAQMIGVAFILVGIIMVFGQIGSVVSLFIKPAFARTRDMVNDLWKPQMLPVNDESGVHDIEAPRKPSIFYFKGLIGPIIILLLFQFFSAAIFIWVEPAWDLQMSLWYVMVTATTVGYGDVSVDTSNEWGLAWASLHILLSVSLLAALIEDINDLRQKRQDLLTQVFQFKKCHEKETIKALDLDHSGELTELEFVLGMLEKIGKLDKKRDIDPIKKMFNGIDANHDGKVNINKLETHEGKMKAKLQKLDDYVQKEIWLMEAKAGKEAIDFSATKVSPDPDPPLPPPALPPPTFPVSPGPVSPGPVSPGGWPRPQGPVVMVPPAYPPEPSWYAPTHTTWYVTW